MSVTPARKSILMMSNSGRNHNLTGDAIRADSYYGRTDGIHTVQIVYNNFQGNFGLQGTLAVEPTDSDWFDINLNANRNVSSADPKVSFPQGTTPTGDTGDTGSMAFTFVGNFTHLRAVVDRSDIPEPAALGGAYPYGSIDKVLLSM
jgi:hypothetical protein